MNENSVHLPPPRSDADFESLCLHLWQEIWGDANAQKNGRSGQSQAGVDVFGRHQGRLIGVQCKLKDPQRDSKVTRAELVAELAKAQHPEKGFQPPLDAFILATTGPRDAALQADPRLLSVSAGIEVSVWAWDDIQAELFRRRDLLKAIYPIYWPMHDWLGTQKVSPSRLPRGPVTLFGRDAELAKLDAAWRDPKVKVVTLVAWGGVGKTSLVSTWMAGPGSKNLCSQRIGRRRRSAPAT